MVTCDPILPKWNEMPVTVLAASNATLLNTVVSILGMNMDTDANEDVANENVKMEACDQDAPVVCSEASIELQSEGVQDEVPIVSDDALSPVVKMEDSPDPVGSSVADNTASCATEGTLPIALPKIHINGKGENSGLKKWQSVLKQIQHM